jgi:Transcriptional Coactivator p15 (PC4)
MPAEPRVVHEFEASRGVVRSTLNDFGGKTYLDLRLWVEPRDQPGAALIPTRRGLSLPVEFLPELTEALEAIREAVKHDQGELVGRARRSKKKWSASDAI